VIESSPDCIIMSDSKGCVIRANGSFRGLLGYDDQEVAGKHVTEFNPPRKGVYELTMGNVVEIGQKFFDDEKSERDESGNIRLKDIGLLLKDRIASYFESKQVDISLKYIDPSYMIRSLPANANDHVFCNFLGRDAVHAGLAGKTKLLIGRWNNHFIHLPMSACVGKRKQISPDGKLWLNVLDATGQESLKNDA